MGVEVQEEVPVLVAGAGPAGLATAAILARYGVETLLVERRSRAVRPAAGDGGQHALHGADALVGARGGGAGRRASTSSGSVWVCETLAAAARRRRAAARAAHPGAERARQPHRAGLRAPGPPGAGAAAPPPLRPVGARRYGHRGRAARQRAGRRPRRAARPRGGDRAACGRALPGRGRRRAQRASGRPSGPDARARRPRHGGLSALFRAPLWDLLGPHRYGLYDINRAGAGGVLPAGRPGRPVALRHHRRSRAGGPRAATGARPWRGASGSRPALDGLRPRIERDGRVRLRRPAGRALPRRERVPGGRRRPPGDAARRHRHEHRHPRRLGPRLEARLGAARLGRARRSSTPTRRSADRSSSTTRRGRPTPRPRLWRRARR